jgi:preprotein translocase subunit SecD
MAISGVAGGMPAARQRTICDMTKCALVAIVVSVVCANMHGAARAAPPASAAPGAGDAVEIAYHIALDRAVDDRATEIRHELEAKLADKKIAAAVRMRMEPGALAIVPGQGTRRGDVEQLLQGEYRDTLVLQSCNPPSEAGAICVQLSPRHADATRAAALSHAAAVVRARLEALAVAPVSVTTRYDLIVVVLPAGDRPELATARWVIARPGRMVWKVVDDGSDYMKHVFGHVGSAGRDDTPSDEQAKRLGIHARFESWRDEAGARHNDYYLDAPDREESVPTGWAHRHGCAGKPAPEPGKLRCTVTGRDLIERYLFGDRELGATGLVAGDPTFRVPDDREIGFEPRDAEDGSRVWRTYYLERRIALGGERISNAMPGSDPNTHAARVVIEFDVGGAKQLAELTRQHVGHKVAFVLDGVVKSAPVVATPILGGRLMTSLGGDPAQATAEARLLAIVLRTGQLPAPLITDTVRPVKR